MLTKEKFNKLWKLNPEITVEHHTQSNTYNLLEYIIKQEERTFDGELIDFNFIAKRYKDYVNGWEQKWGGTEEKYIKAEYKLKSFYIYLDLKLYHSDVRQASPEADPRFKVLFNNCSIEEVEKSFKEFRDYLNT